MFTIDDKQVIFRYSRDSNKRPIATTCIISRLGSDPDSLVACDHAYLNPVDQFSYNTGRKLAMARALQRFPRDERARFWQAYFEHVHGGKH